MNMIMSERECDLRGCCESPKEVAWEGHVGDDV